MINNITKEQRDKIPEFIDTYLKLPTQETDEEVARDVIERIWERMGHDKPIVVFADNPIHARIMRDIYSITFKKKGLEKLDSELNSELYSKLHSELYSELYSELDSELHSDLSSELYSELYSKLYSELHSKLYLELYSELHSELKKLYSELHSKLSSELDSELYSELDSELKKLYLELDSELDSELYSELYLEGKKIKEKFANWYLSTWWIASLGYYKFSKFIGVKLDKEKLSILEDYLSNIQFIIPYKNICFVSRNFKSIKRNDNEELHCEDGYAVEFRGNYGMYCLFSVRIQKKNFRKIMDGTFTMEDLANIENTEERYAILRAKPDLLLEQAELVDIRKKDVEVKYIERDGKKVILGGKIVRHGDVIFKSEEFEGGHIYNTAKTMKQKRINKLYKVDIEDQENNLQLERYFVEKKCPSTGRMYYEWIPKKVAEKNNADVAVAWQCHCTLEEYNRDLVSET